MVCVEYQSERRAVRGEGAEAHAFFTGVLDLAVGWVAVGVGVWSEIDHWIGEIARWRWVCGIVVVIAFAHGCGARGEEEVGGWVVVGKLLRGVVETHAPGKAVVMSLAQPVEFLGHVSARSVFRGKEVAVGCEGEVVGIAQALGKEEALIEEDIAVVGQYEVAGIGRDAQNYGGERGFAQPGEVPIAVLDFAVIGTRAAVDKERSIVGADD